MTCKWLEDQENDELIEGHIESEALWNSQGGLREPVAPEKHVVWMLVREEVTGSHGIPQGECES